jgi:hypothetical protein
VRKNSKKALVCTYAFVLTVLMALSFLSMQVNAAVQILYRTDSFDGGQYSGSGDSWSSYADWTGYHHAYCSKNSWAFALVSAAQAYSGIELHNINVQVSLYQVYVYRNAPLFSKAIAKLWMRFIDTTTSTVLRDDKSQDYGLTWYNYAFQATVYSGHTYRLDIGIWVETGYGWWGNYGTAEGSATIDVMEVTGTA